MLAFIIQYNVTEPRGACAVLLHIMELLQNAKFLHLKMKDRL